MSKIKLSLSNKVLAIILGGGAGTRLSPLTQFRSKPAVPIAGKYRLVDIPISNCINNGINKIFVLTQFNSASLNKHIKNTYHFSMFSNGFVDILAAEQTPESSNWYQGTADAVRRSLKHCVNYDFEYFLILSGDQLYQIDFDHMFKQHTESQCEVTIATIPVEAKEAPEFGILKTNSTNNIISFIEKPQAEILSDWISNTGNDMQAKGRNFLASMGIYIFNRSSLLNILNNEFANATDFGKEIIPNSLSKLKLNSYQYTGYWTDIGNIYSFFEANINLTKNIPEFNLFDSENSIFTRSRMLPPAKINGATISSSLIAEGSIIEANKIENSIIGIRSRIGKNTTIINSYIMGNDSYETINELDIHFKENSILKGIGYNCHIENAIIDKEVYIGNNVTIKGSPQLNNLNHELYTIKDGIVVIKKGAKIVDNFIIS